MSTKSPVSTICLVACAKRASSRSIAGMLKNPGRNSTAAQAIRNSAARKWLPTAKSTIGIISRPEFADFAGCWPAPKRGGWRASTMPSHTLKLHCKQLSSSGPSALSRAQAKLKTSRQGDLKDGVLDCHSRYFQPQAPQAHCARGSRADPRALFLSADHVVFHRLRRARHQPSFQDHARDGRKVFSRQWHRDLDAFADQSARRRLLGAQS